MFGCLLLSSNKTIRSFLCKRTSLHAVAPMSFKILCCDNIDPICVDIFEQNGHTVDYKSKISEEELCKIVGKYDALVVRSGTQVTPEVLSNAVNMKVVGRAGVGVDNINVPSATKHGILVMNTPQGNTISTAQLTFTLLCSLARNIPQADSSMKAGLWKRNQYMGVELSGKTVAILGCGRIGQTVARWAQSLNMTVLGFDPALSVSDANMLGIKLLPLSEIWPLADFITVHTPLTPGTRNLISKSSIAQMKDGVRIINCARGGIINECDLVEALNSGKVKGAALDVYEQEPPTAALELLKHPNLVCTPHLGASTDEAQINVARDIALQMCAALDGKAYVGVVNVDYMELVNNQHVAPLVDLSNVLGRLVAQKYDSKITSVELQSWGEHAVSLDSDQLRNFLLAVVLKGIFSVQPEETVPSLINAPLLATLAGIKTTTSPGRYLANSPYTNLITVKVGLENGEEHAITGTVSGKTVGSIVQIDNYKSFPAFRPQGTMLSYKFEDRPGAVAKVLQILSEENINLATLALGREDAEDALMLIDLDTTPSSELLQKLKKLPDLREVRLAAVA